MDKNIPNLQSIETKIISKKPFRLLEICYVF